MILIVYSAILKCNFALIVSISELYLCVKKLDAEKYLVQYVENYFLVGDILNPFSMCNSSYSFTLLLPE